jgi:2-polyprenyl-3-methyl-5-hydroxy-6-metoxy-1,4-benzoquinol methylase
VNRPGTDDLPRQLGSMFSSRWDRRYVPAKMRSDPLYEAVLKQLGSSPLRLLDIGCGLGLLAFYLRSHGFQPPVLSIDYDERKIAEASRVAGRAGFEDLWFRHHDVRDGLPDHSGNVTILDILHFFKREPLLDLLRAAAGCVAPGGRLIIRTGINDGSWRYRATAAGDVLAKLTLWMKAGPVRYPTHDDLGEALAPFGRLTIDPLWGRTPFNSHLVVLQRDDQSP